MSRLVLATLLTLSCQSGNVFADQEDPRLEELFKQLHDATDADAAAPLEQAIWAIWFSHPDSRAQQLMQQGVDQMNSGALDACIATFSQLVEVAPEWAEGWNRRATAYYLGGDYAKSELDIQKTLQLEPFHFGALSGRGLVKMGLKDYEGARAAFSAALEVNPGMDAVRNNLRELEEFLRRRSI